MAPPRYRNLRLFFEFSVLLASSERSPSALNVKGPCAQLLDTSRDPGFRHGAGMAVVGG